MAFTHPGFSEAMGRIYALDEPGLYRVLDALFGRDNLPDDPTIGDLRDEARRQTREGFRDATDQHGWDLVETCPP